jgi:hypothetical protein
MANYNEQMQQIFDRYRKDVHDAPTALDDVYDWATRSKLWEPSEESKRAQFKEDMAQALREEYRTDKAGRRYRAKHAVRHMFKGRQMSFWGDIDTDPRDYMVIAFQQRRRRIAGEVHQLKVDVDHYNDVHPGEAPIQLCMNFEEDVLERLVEEGLATAA